MTIVNMVGGGGESKLTNVVEVGYGVDRFITSANDSGSGTSNGQMLAWMPCGSAYGNATKVTAASRARYAVVDENGKPKAICNAVLIGYSGSITQAYGVSSVTIDAGAASTGIYNGIPAGTTGTAYLVGSMVSTDDQYPQLIGTASLTPVKVKFNGTHMVTEESVKITSVATSGFYSNYTTKVGAYVIYVMLD